MKVCVYTAVFGDTDLILPPKGQNEGIDFIAFTDNPARFPEPWKCRKYEGPLGISGRLKSRYLKFIGPEILREYDISIWIDGSIRPVIDLHAALNEFTASNKSIALMKHPVRSTIKEEADQCVNTRKISASDETVLRKQVTKYLNEGFPDGGLIESGVIFRRHLNPQLSEAMTLWWSEVQQHSARDQVSLPYVLWKSGIEPHIWKWNIRNIPGPFVVNWHLNGTFDDTVNYYAARKSDSIWFKAAYICARAYRKLVLRSGENRA